MPRRNDADPERARQLRAALQEVVESGGMPLAEAIRRMRESLGMTQAKFAEVFKLTPRQVWELGNGRANPTVETMNRLGRPFGFTAGFVKRPPGQPG